VARARAAAGFRSDQIDYTIATNADPCDPINAHSGEKQGFGGDTAAIRIGIQPQEVIV
jgi:hypothetical protein